MDEELNYSTVIFRNEVTPKETKQEETVYAEVKVKQDAPNESATIQDGEPAPHTRRFCVLAACLGVLCVLLVSAIAAIIYLNTVISNYSDLTSQNMKLRTERANLERQAEDLTRERDSLTRERDSLNRERDSLNWTLEVILQFDNFPVNDYCSHKECKPCLDDWVLFQSSCYLILHLGYEWKTWDIARRHCQEKTADLVVIGSPEEQEFISNHTQFYYDIHHGYWIGLTNNIESGRWLWVDGSNVTAGYWKEGELGSGGHCTMTIANMDPLANWAIPGCGMKNRWICEANALIKSDQLAP